MAERVVTKRCFKCELCKRFLEFARPPRVVEPDCSGFETRGQRRALARASTVHTMVPAERPATGDLAVTVAAAVDNAVMTVRCTEAR